MATALTMPVPIDQDITATDNSTASSDGSQLNKVDPFMAAFSVHANLLSAAYEEDDKRLVGRVLRHLTSTRRSVKKEGLAQMLSFYANQSKSAIIAHLSKTICGKNEYNTKTNDISAPSLVPTIEIYVALLAMLYLLDNGAKEEACSTALAAVQALRGYDLRALDPLAARLYHYMALLHPDPAFLTRYIMQTNYSPFLCASFCSVFSCECSVLMGALTTANLRHDEESRAALHNAILRLHCLQGDYDAASKLLAKAPFPDDRASSPSLARHFYWMALVKAMEGSYEESLVAVMQAIRKGPPFDLRRSAQPFSMSSFSPPKGIFP